MVGDTRDLITFVKIRRNEPRPMDTTLKDIYRTLTAELKDDTSLVHVGYTEIERRWVIFNGI